jgi:hypothetical protein
MYNTAVDTPSGMSKAAFLRAFLKVRWSVSPTQWPLFPSAV